MPVWHQTLFGRVFIHLCWELFRWTGVDHSQPGQFLGILTWLYGWQSHLECDSKVSQKGAERQLTFISSNTYEILPVPELGWCAPIKASAAGRAVGIRLAKAANTPMMVRSWHCLLDPLHPQRAGRDWLPSRVNSRLQIPKIFAVCWDLLFRCFSTCVSCVAVGVSNQNCL